MYDQDYDTDFMDIGYDPSVSFFFMHAILNFYHNKSILKNTDNRTTDL